MRIAIIDTMLGNLRSVYNAFEFLGAAPYIASNSSELRKADKIVLPGVGAFGPATSALVQNGWVDELHELVRQDEKPFLGICLGMQLLAQTGYEEGEFSGLGWVQGVVELMESRPDCPIPHIGWNDVQFPVDSRLGKGLEDGGVFYFVHSYVLQPTDADLAVGLTTHASPFVACIEQGNIWGTQFHPEKSQQAGLVVLKNFLET